MWLIVAILLFYVTGVVQDRNTLLRSQYSVLAGKNMKLDALARETMWLERAKDVDLQVAALLKRIPLVRSEGIAKAKVENVFSKLLKKNAIEGYRLNIERINVIKGFAGGYQIVVTIKGRFLVESFFSLLYDLETMPQEGNVLGLQIARGKSSRFKLTYALYYRIDG